MRSPISVLISSFHKLRLVLLYIVIVAFCTSCETKTPVQVQSVSISKTALSLVEGESERLSATVSPDNASDYIIAWSSSNPAVASVQDGLVTAEKEGSASITVSAGGKSASCSVTVSAKEIPVTSVSLSQTSVEMLEGEEVTLTAKVEPDNATHKQLTWSSSDEKVATVKDGLVSAGNAGIATISVSAGGKTASCTIKVKSIPVTSVTLNKTSLEMVEGDEFTLTATVKPDNATNVKLSWSSSDENIVFVDEGKLTAIGIGVAKVTVKAGDKTAVCDVSVSKKIIHVESIEIDVTQKRLKVGETIVLHTTVSPKEANNYEIVYRSSDSRVASVTQDGIVEGVSPGSTTIHIEADGVTVDCRINVFEKDIIYAPTTKFVDYNYYVGTLWQNQDAIITAKDYSFSDMYLMGNQPFIVAYGEARDNSGYSQIYNNNYHRFDPGEGSNRSFCSATIMRDNDLYSLVEWKYSDGQEFYGVWKNQDKLYDLGDDAKITKYSRCVPGGLFLDGGDLYVFGLIVEPLDENNSIEIPVLWKDGRLFKRLDHLVNGTWSIIIDVVFINGKRCYILAYGDDYRRFHYAVFDDNVKLYDLNYDINDRTSYSNHQVCQTLVYKGKLYAAIINWDSKEGTVLSFYEDNKILYQIPNVHDVDGASFDIIDGDIYLLVVLNNKWGGQVYNSVAVYRGANKEYTLIDDTPDPLYVGKIKVFSGD